MATPYNKNKSNASNSDPYIKRQAAYKAQQEEEYRKWKASLSSSEFQVLKDLKVDKPQISYVVKGTGKQDAAECALASYEVDYAAIIDGKEQNEVEQPTKLDAVEAVRRLLAELMNHRNIRLTVDCLALVFGLWANQGESQTDIAKRNEVSPAAVSKRCIDLCEKFGTPVPGGMHSKKAKNSTKPGKKRKK
ncbi:MAG: hypothetical protein RLZZ398_201 [Verrucomicrobiota bacterium]|jgi:hypothetical protein